MPARTRWSTCVRLRPYRGARARRPSSRRRPTVRHPCPRSRRACAPPEPVRRRGPQLRPARRPQPRRGARAAAARSGPAGPGGKLRHRAPCRRPPRPAGLRPPAPVRQLPRPHVAGRDAAPSADVRDTAGRRRRLPAPAVERLIDIVQAAGDPRRAGLAADGAILVRPDGYIGFRAAPADHAGLSALDSHLDSYLVPA